MTRKTGFVISLCDRTGIMVEPWADAGWPCECVDMQHPPGLTEGHHPNIRFRGMDVRDYGRVTNAAIVFAFSPCTDLAVSGARWWKDKGLRRLGEAIQIVGACLDVCESSAAPWMIENPIGALSTHWRKPDAKFDPCDYGGYLTPPGDAYTKRTCLWIGGGFVVPTPKPVFPVEGSRMHLIPPSPDRANIRSETPAGFARAVFEANSHILEAAS